MFDRLSSALQGVFRNLRGYGRLTERNVQDALREVRRALLEADVNYEVARDFIARVREACLGEAVLSSVTPGQQIVKRIHDELVRLLGGSRRDFTLSPAPAGVLLLGLHGAGKTTTAAKLARTWSREGRRVLLAACDLRRPAAVEQLRALAARVGVDAIGPEPGDTVAGAGARALETARREGYGVVLYDSGGRFQVDPDLVAELHDLHRTVAPANTVLVLDAATGREAVAVARTFHESVGLTGLVLTKLDGDARGGAALSVHAATGCPILRVGTGEKPEDLEPFHPDRIAARILGMGDVVGLVEKAQTAFDADQAAAMERKLRRNAFNLDDFLDQLRGVQRMGPLENLVEMLPGASRLPENVRRGLSAQSGPNLKRTEAILLSMTPEERRHPERIDGRRRARIARGSGTRPADVNELLRGFRQSQRMMKRFRHMGKALRGRPF